MSALPSLDQAAARVLGALMEKEMTTPDLYPLSLNALVAAANQRSSREPVMDLAEDEVCGALYRLETESLVVPARSVGRAERFEHRIRTVLSLRRDETAVLCLLLLRGPQTPGELRARSERLFAFEDLPQVQAALDRLAAREQPLVAALPRAPGSRETRYAELLSESATTTLQPASPSAAPVAVAASAETQSLAGRVAQLEQQIVALEQRLRALEGAAGRGSLPSPHPQG